MELHLEEESGGKTTAICVHCNRMNNPTEDMTHTNQKKKKKNTSTKSWIINQTRRNRFKLRSQTWDTWESNSVHTLVVSQSSLPSTEKISRQSLQRILVMKSGRTDSDLCPLGKKVYLPLNLSYITHHHPFHADWILIRFISKVSGLKKKINLNK